MKRITWSDILGLVIDDPKPNKPITVPVQNVKKIEPEQKTSTQIEAKVNPAQIEAVKKTESVSNINESVTPATQVQEKKTTMNSDSAFVIGSTHDVCEDYIASRNDGLKSYVVLADGCSGSKDTDVGARVLVKTHETYIPRFGAMDFNEYANRAKTIYKQIIKEASDNAKSLNLSPTSLDATLMSIVSNKRGEFMITCYGDGVVALCRKDGIIEIYTVSYSGGYPNYLSYELSDERREKFDNQPDNHREVIFEMISKDDEPLKQKYRSSAIFDIYLNNKEKYKWVAILSDGATSFVEKKNDGMSIVYEPVPTHKVIKEMLDFKNFQGTFVKRRLKRFLESCASKNWTHTDDVSVGVVYLGED